MAALACATQALAATGDEVLIETIIVTARKVEEDRQHVPMSVQVLAAQVLEHGARSRPLELQFVVPGLVVNNQGGFGAGFALRGVTNASVATHLDGVYQGESNLAITRLFDIERIEVLKGPQGTLYGRDSSGGSINIFTQSPVDGFGAGIEGVAGSFDARRLNAHLNLPVPGGAVRLAATGSGSDGYIRNTVDDRRFAQDDYHGLRVALRLDPAENLGIDLRAQHVEDDGASSELWLPPPAYLPDPDDIRKTTVTLRDPMLETASDNLSLRLERDMGFASLRSISGYARSEVRNRDDCAGMPVFAGCVREILPLRYRQWSQELQLVPAASDALDWLAGAYFDTADEDFDYSLTLPLINPDPLNDYAAESDSRTVAAFAQATVRPRPRWALTGGLRLSRDEHREEELGTGVADHPGRLVARSDSGRLSWRVDLAHEAREDLLLFGGVSTGYKSGGFTTQVLPGNRRGELDRVDPENTLAFELGLKSRWFERRLLLDATLFHYEISDMQVQVRGLVGDSFVSTIDNAAEARVSGLDAMLEARFDERLSLAAALVWMPEREFEEYRSDASGADLSGNTLPRAPEWSGTVSLDYRRALPGLGTLSASLGYDRRSTIHFTQDNDPALVQREVGLLNAGLRFEAPDARWYVFATAHNLLGEDYFTQVFIQSAPGYPDTWEAGIGLRF